MHAPPVSLRLTCEVCRTSARSYSRRSLRNCHTNLDAGSTMLPSSNLNSNNLYDVRHGSTLPRANRSPFSPTSSCKKCNASRSEPRISSIRASVRLTGNMRRAMDGNDAAPGRALSKPRVQ